MLNIKESDLSKVDRLNQNLCEFDQVDLDEKGVIFEKIEHLCMLLILILIILKYYQDHSQVGEKKDID